MIGNLKTFRNSFLSDILIVPQQLDSSYYPSLNGLRGVAIIIVLMEHLRLFDNNLYYTVFNGPLGVNIFFVLSGFLITTICLKEKTVTGKLSLKSFYIRRILRILPVAYLYILVVLLLNFFFHLELPGFQILGAVFFVMNLSFFRKNNFTWLVGHFWTLSTEEQFYIFLPFTLKIGYKIFLTALFFLIIFTPFLCIAQYFFPVINQGILYASTHYFIKFLPIAIGCLFSILTFKGIFFNDVFTKTKLLGNLFAFFILFYVRYNNFYSLQFLFTNFSISILTGYIIVTNLIPSNDFIFKFLNTKALSFIGILSYSIYIWQQIFTSGIEKFPSFLIKFPSNLILIAVFSSASYFLFERYFLDIKKRYTSKRMFAKE